MPTGVNLNQYSGSRSCIPWHSDNESLFGPPNQPMLIVSMSLGHSVQFQVRRGQYGVASPIQLYHCDILVMDGPAQSECAHRTVPRVNLTFRRVTQHNATCPPVGVVGCVVPLVCARLSRAKFPLVGEGENKWILLLGFQSLGSSSWLTLGFITGGGIVTVVGVHPTWRCTSPRGVLPVGLVDGVGECHDAADLQKSIFISFFYLFRGKSYVFSGVWFIIFGVLLDMLEAKRVPSPCYRDASSVVTPRWACRGNTWRPTVRAHFHPSIGVSCQLVNAPFFKFGS